MEKTPHDLVPQIRRMVMVQQTHMRTCAVCGRIAASNEEYEEEDDDGGLCVLEDVGTKDGIVACKGEHARMASRAMFLHQSARGYCSIRFTHAPGHAPPGHAVGLLDVMYAPDVRFYRMRTGQVQEGRIAVPAYLYYCEDHSTLCVPCEWAETDLTELKRMVSVENLFHYNPTLRMHFVYEITPDAPDDDRSIWQRHLDACRERARADRKRTRDAMQAGEKRDDARNGPKAFEI